MEATKRDNRVYDAEKRITSMSAPKIKYYFVTFKNHPLEGKAFIGNAFIEDDFNLMEEAKKLAEKHGLKYPPFITGISEIPKSLYIENDSEEKPDESS